MRECDILPLLNIITEICRRLWARTHLVVDFVEGVLQLPVDSGQFFEVPVGFVDGQQKFVHFIYGFVHCGLEESEDKAMEFIQR